MSSTTTATSRLEPASKAALGLLVVGALVRLGYVLDYEGFPFLGGPIGDTRVYLDQATHVLAGEHGAASLLAMSPLYGYVLAAFGAVEGAWPILFVQMVAGLLSGYLLHRIVAKRFDAWSGVGALALYLGYGLFPFYETKLLTEALMVPLLVGVLALTISPERDRHPVWQVVAGVLMALAVMQRSSLFFAAVLLPAAALLPWHLGESWKQRIRRAGSIACGLALVFCVRGVITHQASGEWVSVVYTAPQASAVTGTAGTDDSGQLQRVAFDGAGPASAWDVVEAVAAHREAGGDSAVVSTLGTIDLAAFARVAPRKFVRALRDVESSHQYAYYGERARSRALNAHPWTFSLIVWLGCIGAYLLARREGWRRLVPFAPIVAGTLAVLLLYIPSSRYRLPITLPAIILGGVALRQLFERRRERVAQVMMASTLVLAAVTGYRNVAYTPRHPERWHLVLAESYASHAPPLQLATVEEVERALSVAGEHGPVSDDVKAHARAVLDLAGIDVRTTRLAE